MRSAAGCKPCAGDFTTCFWKEEMRTSMSGDVSNERLVLETMETRGSCSLGLSIFVVGEEGCGLE